MTTRTFEWNKQTWETSVSGMPDFKNSGMWWREFLAALDAWWQEQPADGSVAEDVSIRLGSSTPLKRWLVRLYAKRLRMIEETGNIGKLVRTT